MNVKDNKSGFGLLAFGSSRSWEVTIEESLSHDEEWIAEIEGPNVYLTFQLRDLRIVSEMQTFLSQHPDKDLTGSKRYAISSLILGKFGQTDIELVWDDEDFDRCFLIAVGDGHCILRISLLGEDIQMFKEAVSQVVSDLE